MGCGLGLHDSEEERAGELLLCDVDRHSGVEKSADGGEVVVDLASESRDVVDDHCLDVVLPDGVERAGEAFSGATDVVVGAGDRQAVLVCVLAAAGVLVVQPLLVEGRAASVDDRVHDAPPPRVSSASSGSVDAA